MAIDDNTSYELTGYQVKDLAGRIRRKAEASSVPTSISDLGQVTSSDIDWSTLNVVIDDNPTRATFFGGTYSKQFTVPASGYYEINTPFSCVCNRVANNRNYLELTIDGTVEFVYGYFSVNSDTDWGTTRRTITSSDFVIYLTAGTHTIGTQGNLYYDSNFASYSALKTFYAKYFSE